MVNPAMHQEAIMKKMKPKIKVTTDDYETLYKKISTNAKFTQATIPTEP